MSASNAVTNNVSSGVGPAMLVNCGRTIVAMGSPAAAARPAGGTRSSEPPRHRRALTPLGLRSLFTGIVGVLFLGTTGSADPTASGGSASESSPAGHLPAHRASLDDAPGLGIAVDEAAVQATATGGYSA